MPRIIYQKLANLYLQYDNEYSLLRHIHCNTVKLLEPLDFKFDLKVSCYTKTTAMATYYCVRCKRDDISAGEMLKSRNKIQSKCKQCDRELSKERYNRNRESRLQTVKAYTEKNSEKIKSYQSDYRQEHKEETKIYNASYRQENKITLREKRRVYESQPHVRIRSALQKRLRKALNNQDVEKSLNTMPLLGCTIEYFKLWIEFQFTENMSMDKYSTHVGSRKYSKV